jgi:hypothetical protein
MTFLAGHNNAYCFPSRQLLPWRRDHFYCTPPLNKCNSGSPQNQPGTVQLPYKNTPALGPTVTFNQGGGEYGSDSPWTCGLILAHGFSSYWEGKESYRNFPFATLVSCVHPATPRSNLAVAEPSGALSIKFLKSFKSRLLVHFPLQTRFVLNWFIFSYLCFNISLKWIQLKKEAK